MEGVVALQRRFGDLGVYVDAAVDDVEGWYVARFQELVRAEGLPQNGNSAPLERLLS